jgi:hypothetical protein
MYTSSVIHQLIENKPDGTGLDARYFSVNDDVGFKAFHYEDKAIHTMEKQAELHSHGFAPAVLSDVIESGDYYGFYTEKAITVEDYLGLVHGINARNTSFYDEVTIDGKTYTFEHVVYFNNYIPIFPDLDEFIEEMQETGYYDTDIHIGNYGWLRSNGKPVVIDTGGQVKKR